MSVVALVGLVGVGGAVLPEFAVSVVPAVSRLVVIALFIVSVAVLCVAVKEVVSQALRSSRKNVCRGIPLSEGEDGWLVGKVALGSLEVQVKAGVERGDGCCAGASCGKHRWPGLSGGGGRVVAFATVPTLPAGVPGGDDSLQTILGIHEVMAENVGRKARYHLADNGRDVEVSMKEDFDGGSGDAAVRRLVEELLDEIEGYSAAAELLYLRRVRPSALAWGYYACAENAGVDRESGVRLFDLNSACKIAEFIERYCLGGGNVVSGDVELMLAEAESCLEGGEQ